MSAKAAGHRATRRCACAPGQRRARLAGDARAAGRARRLTDGPTTARHRTDPTAVPADVRLMNVDRGRVRDARRDRARRGRWCSGSRASRCSRCASIRIDGDVTRNSVATIRANAAPQLAGNFFTLDLAAGRRAFESVPWVRQAVVRPGLAEPAAGAARGAPAGRAVEHATGSAEKLVNSFGEVFEANLGDVEDDGLPTLQRPRRQRGARCSRLFGRARADARAGSTRASTR